ncbi:MAG: AMP-binding protein [Pseudonocardiaceae bacterium]
MTDSLDMLAGRSATDEIIVEPASGVAHTAAALRRLGTAFAARLSGTGKLLVHLIAERSVESIAVYLECLRLGHAVLLVDPRLRNDRQVAVRDSFQPDVIVDTRGVSSLARPDYSAVAPLGTTTILVRRGGASSSVPRPVAVLLATSGSVGGFRLVCLSYANLASNASAIGQALDLRPNDRGALCLPLAFSYGLSVLNSHLTSGGSVAVMNTAPTSLAFWPLFEAAGCTTFAGVPETYRILDAIGHRLADHPTLRLATQAGSRMSEPLVVRTATGLVEAGKDFAVMYGQTEATARIACQCGSDVLRSPRSVGTVIPGSRLWTVRPDGSPQGDDEPGEIVLAGPGVMLGYAYSRNDLSTVPHEPSPNLRTGDLGYLSDGRLHIVGRLGRLAKPFGVRVQLDDVEADFTAVGPAAVVTGDDETIVVYVEGSPATYRTAYRTILASYALPPSVVRVVPVDRIPRTISGKIAYSQLPDVNQITDRTVEESQWPRSAPRTSNSSS